MYKLRFREEVPWWENFTLYENRWTTGAELGVQVFAPFWECKTAGCGQRFPAGHKEVNYGNILGFGADGSVRYGKKFIFDSECGPMMNDEYIAECPYCRGE